MNIENELNSLVECLNISAKQAELTGSSSGMWSQASYARQLVDGILKKLNNSNEFCITIEEANSKIFSTIHEILIDQMRDYMRGDLDVNYFEHWYNYQNRITNIVRCNNYDQRIQKYTEIALEYMSMFDDALEVYTSVVIQFEDVRMVFSIK